MQDRDLEMCVCAFVSVSEEMPFGNLVKTQAQLWIPSHLLLRIAQGERGGSAASTEQKRFMPLSLTIFPSCLPCLCSLLSFACPPLQDGALRRLRSSWNNVHLSSAVSRPGRSQVQEDLGLSSKPLPKC